MEKTMHKDLFQDQQSSALGKKPQVIVFLAKKAINLRGLDAIDIFHGQDTFRG